MNIPDNGKQQYIEATSFVALAKEWNVSLVTLEAYANEQGWDREHKLYWQDKAIEMLKNAASEDNITAVRELLKAMGISRPVGRPSKTEVTKQIAIEAKIEQEFSADIARLASYAKQA